jgi:uncharacterized OsmC-like protein
MDTQSINVLGYTGPDSRFTVRTYNTQLQLSDKIDANDRTNPYEYLLAGFAGYINGVGRHVAAGQGILLQSLQVEIKADPLKDEKPGFESIRIVVMPTTKATLASLQKWLKDVQSATSVYNSISATQPEFVLYKEYSHT